MRCEHCGQSSDWVGDDSEWESVSNRAVARGLYVCSNCGNQQYAR